MKTIVCSILLIIGLLAPPQAAGFKVSGVVKDDEGLEVIGGSVKVKGHANMGVITDIDGRYTIDVPSAKESVLEFSLVGMMPVEVKVNGKSTIDVTLRPDSKVLNEVVVVGYGTQKRSDLTGSVVSVKSKDLQTTPTSDPLQALAGKAAGVMITQDDGEPGAAISVRVRGGISITQSNEPLYIIDGFPSEDGLAGISPSEIETIDVLKDASATAIYGARGANGVVVVTTKKGNDDDASLQITFDAYAGVRKVSRKLAVLDVQEFLLLDYERSLAFNGQAGVTGFQNRYGSFVDIAKNYADRPGIDWQKEALGRTASTQNYHVGINGGTKDVKYNFNYTYSKDQGSMILSGTNKHTVSLGVSQTNRKWLAFNAKATYTEQRTWGMGTSDQSTRFNKMEHILQYRPTAGIYGDDNSLLTGNDMLEDDDQNPMQSPIISANEEDHDRITRNVLINGGFTLTFNKYFTFRNSTGYRYQMDHREDFYGEKSVIGKRSSIQSSSQYNESTQFQTSNVLTYNNRHKYHKLTVMLGQEWVDNRSRWMRAVVKNYPNNDIGSADASLGTPESVTSNVNYDNKILSFFGRVNYSIGDKYLFTATLRADGSSKFSKRNKWGYFPSVSAAWRIGQEEFIERLGVFSDLKLRAGYGLAGNNRVASYRSLDILTSAGYPSGDSFQPGYAPYAIPAKDLKWESNATLNVGLDIGFFNQRLIIAPEFFYNRSTNLLLNSRVPASSGFKTMLRNVGQTSNRGLDLSVNTVNIVTRDFQWNTALNLSVYRNRIEKLSGEEYFLEEAAFGYNDKTHIIAVGAPVGQFYGYRTVGLYQVDDFDYDAATGTYTLKSDRPVPLYNTGVQPGYWKFEDTDKNGVIDENDKTVIGNANPKFFGGFTNNFTWRNFDASVFFTFSVGGKVLNATKLTNSQAGRTNYNVLATMSSSDRWMTIDANGNSVTDPTTLAALNAGKTTASIFDTEQGDTYVHSWGVEDASYLRLSNLSVGYTIPRNALRKLSIEKLRFYFTASNVFVVTGYSGFDPEVSTKGNNLTPGVDFGAYPRNRSYVFGLNLSF